MLAHKGDWVVIEQVFLTANQRQQNIPPDTQEVDFCLRIKGFLSDESSVVGDRCSIITKTQRAISGKLIDIFPKYDHSFGDYLPETTYIEDQLREMLSHDSDE